MRYYFLTMFIFGGGLGILSFVFSSILKCDKRKKIYITLFASYIGALIAFTLLPGGVVIEQGISLIPFKDLFMNISRKNWYYILQMLVNIFMFMPFGVFLYIAGANIKKTCLFGFLLSFGIEIFEFVTGRGIFDIDDLILNTLGALMGFLLAKLVLNPVTSSKLVFMILLYCIVVILTAVSVYRLDRHYRDEYERQAMIIWTPENVMRFDGYDPEYTFDFEEDKGSFVFSEANKDNSYVRIDVDTGKVKVTGEGDTYAWFKPFYNTADGWEELKAVGSDTPEYRNIYKAGNYMIIFMNKDMLIVVPGFNNGTVVRFEREDM